MGVVRVESDSEDTESVSNKIESSMSGKSVFGDYGQVLERVGLLPGECHIHDDPNVAPVSHHARRMCLQD